MSHGTSGPSSGPSDTDVVEVARTVVAAHRGDRGALLPILHGIQHALGHVPTAAVPVVAAELNLSRADVHGVVSFYKDFRRTPPGRSVVGLCRAEACQAVGADALVDEVERRLGVECGTTRDDGAVTLDEIFCLGNCALGPSAIVDGRVLGRVTADTISALVDAPAAQEARS